MPVFPLTTHLRSQPIASIDSRHANEKGSSCQVTLSLQAFQGEAPYLAVVISCPRCALSEFLIGCICEHNRIIVLSHKVLESFAAIATGMFCRVGF